MAIRRRKKPSLVLPLSSMGDIAFLLIIFFMLASNFMKTANVDLQKSTSPDIDQQEAAKASVMIDKDGVIWYEGHESTKEEVEESLKILAEKNDDKEKGVEVHVTIDHDLVPKDYMPIINAVSTAGCKMVLTGDKED